MAHLGVYWTHVSYGIVACLIAIIVLDWRGKGLQSASHYLGTLLLAFVISVVILVGQIGVVVAATHK
jgi:hypothetical protein